MNPDFYIYAIVALLPLVAGMVILQRNPYHALVTRGILGALAALIYALLGAADVALTEALVGTMLAITLYAVAVRSSLILRLGVLKESLPEAETAGSFQQLLDRFRHAVKPYHLRLELVPYQHPEDLEQALRDQEVHVTCRPLKPDSGEEIAPYHTITRIPRIYELLQGELSDSLSRLSHFSAQDVGGKH